MLTITQAANELGIEPGTLRMQVSKGKIAAISVGGKGQRAGMLLIHRDELDRYRRDRAGKPGRRPKEGTKPSTA